jgi:hypothetical protein
VYLVFHPVHWSRRRHASFTVRPWLGVNHNFRPAASDIRRGTSETDCLSAGIRQQTQREQIGKTEGSLDVESVVRFQPDADRECCRGEAL